MRPRFGLRTAAIFCLVALVQGTAAVRADDRLIEAVGAVPVGSGSLGGISPRDAAIRAALHEAVSRVAHELLWETDVADDVEARLEAVLGSNMARYTTRFRILEDRGERPSLFSDDPELGSEYVVVVAVSVDLARLSARLRAAGLLPEVEAATGRQLRVEVRGLHVYAAFEALRVGLVEGAGARAAVPAVLERGRTLFVVDTEQSPLDILDGLLTSLSGGLEITPIRSGPDFLVLQARWDPAASDPLRGDGPQRTPLPPGSVDSDRPDPVRTSGN